MSNAIVEAIELVFHSKLKLELIMYVTCALEKILVMRNYWARNSGVDMIFAIACYFYKCYIKEEQETRTVDNLDLMPNVGVKTIALVFLLEAKILFP